MRWRDVSPRQAALRIVDAWLGDSGERAPSRLPLTEYQHAAVARIEGMLERWRGALLADDVGLGKTFVALGIIERQAKHTGSIALVIPASLRRHWQRHLRRLPVALRDRTTILTHTALSFGNGARAGPFRLLVIDEAHAFRNPRTRRYATLARLAPDAQVLLLSATPINNRLDDLYHLIRLFAADHDFRELGVASLQDAFRRAAAEPRAQQAVQRVLSAIMVRRSRDQVTVQIGGPAFPQRQPAIAVRYDLCSAYGSAWPQVYDALQQLGFAAFSDSGVAGATELMRLQLLKRLESSVAAFLASLRRQHRVNQLLLESLGHGRWINPAMLRSLVLTSDADAQLVLNELVTEPVPRAVDAAELAARVTDDLSLLRGCLNELDAAITKADPKLAALRSLVDAEKTGILVFTQYRDTAVYLWKRLHRHARVGLVHGSDARLGAQRAARTTVIECFAPRANGARPPPERLRLDLLIATDVLSEGLNLQDAGVVVSYDLPWNPVTLMQRIGRIDRLGSAHEQIRVYNFWPDRGLDLLLRLIQRIERKLDLIGRTVGGEAVLHGTAPHDSSIAAEALNAFTELAELESLRAAARRHQSHKREAGWLRSHLRHAETGWLIAVRDHGRVRLLIADQNGIREDVRYTCRILQSALTDDAPPQNQPEGPHLEHARDWLAAEHAARRLDRLPACATAQTAATRLLLSRLNDTPGSAELLSRADRLLERLAQPVGPQAWERIDALMTMRHPQSLAELLTGLERSLSSKPSNRKRQPGFEPLAALRFAPAPVSIDPASDRR